MDIIKEEYAIYSYPYYPYYYYIAFGGGHDLFCNYDQCYSNLGHSYQMPSFLTYGSNAAQSFLGGSSSFQAVEIEVYWINLETEKYTTLIETHFLSSETETQFLSSETETQNYFSSIL